MECLLADPNAWSELIVILSYTHLILATKTSDMKIWAHSEVSLKADSGNGLDKLVFLSSVKQTDQILIRKCGLLCSLQVMEDSIVHWAPKVV